MSAVNEMRKLTNKVRKELYQINCPALIIHAAQDKLSPQSNVPLVYNSISSEIKEKHRFFNLSVPLVKRC